MMKLAHIGNAELCCLTLLLTLHIRVTFCVKPSAKDEINLLMLKLHNEARAKILQCLVPGQPPAKVMPNLTYDQELAERAQTWANKCKFGHDSDADRVTSEWKKVGQNFAGNSNLESAFNKWFGEHNYYNFDAINCSAKACGHYTQIVWACTTEIGCAFTECDASLTGFPYGKAIVCNYGTAGNRRNTRPYKKGDDTQCTATTTPSAAKSTTSTIGSGDSTATDDASKTTTDSSTKLANKNSLLILSFHSLVIQITTAFIL